MREWDGQDGGRTERKSKETDIFFEQAIMVLARNLALGKFPGIHRMTPAKVLSNSGVWRGCLNWPSPVIRLTTTLIVIITLSSSN